MYPNLIGRRVAILVEDGFEQVELTSPMGALGAAGAEIDIVSPRPTTVRGWQHGEWGSLFSVTRPVREVGAADYDALVLPGGVINPDRLRRDERSVEFVREFFAAGKPVAAICHGPQMLIEAGIVRGRRLTSFASIRTDLQNAGARWVDEALVIDEGLVTSRSPEDLPHFNRGMVEEFTEGRHPVASGAGTGGPARGTPTG